MQEAHRAYQRELKAAGTLLAAGPHDPRFGGMFLVRLPDDNPHQALDAIRRDAGRGLDRACVAALERVVCDPGRIAVGGALRTGADLNRAAVTAS